MIHVAAVPGQLVRTLRTSTVWRDLSSAEALGAVREGALAMTLAVVDDHALVFIFGNARIRMGWVSVPTIEAT